MDQCSLSFTNVEICYKYSPNVLIQNISKTITNYSYHNMYNIDTWNKETSKMGEIYLLGGIYSDLGTHSSSLES